MYYLVPDVWELFLRHSRSFSRNQSGICFHLSSLNKSLGPDGLSSVLLSPPASSVSSLSCPPLTLKPPQWCWREKRSFKLKGFLTVLNQYPRPDKNLKTQKAFKQHPGHFVLSESVCCGPWVLLLLSSGDTMIPLFAYVLEHRGFQTRIKMKT